MTNITDIAKTASKSLMSDYAKKRDAEIRSMRNSLSYPARFQMDRMQAALEFVQSREDVTECEGCDNYIHDDDEEAVEGNDGKYCHQDCLDEVNNQRAHEDTGRTV